MTLTPEVVEAHRMIMNNPAKYDLTLTPFADCWEKSDVCTPKHILAKEYMDYVDINLPKFIVYIIMDEQLLQHVGKSDNGDIGFYLKMVATK